MSKAFSSRTNTVLFTLAAVLMAASPAQASKKDDQYKLAKQAMDAGKADEAAQIFCAIAKEDSGFKDVQMMCNVMTTEAGRIRKQDEKRFADGEQAFKEGRYDDAEQKFQNVKTAPLAAQAKDYLGKITAGRAEEGKFQQGVQAYNANDFGRAKDLLGGIAAGRAAEARGYLDKIKRYEQFIADGGRANDARNFKEAATAYNEAAQIKSDGPGDPRGKAAQMNTLASAATPATGTRGGATTTAQVSTQTGSQSGGVGSAAAPAKIASANAPAAVKPVTPNVDVAKLTREAEVAKTRGEIGAAKGKYLAILAAEPGNAKARVGLETLPKAPAGTQQQSAGAEADIMLARGISEFYTGQYEDSDVHIREYVEVNGAKLGLAYFYLGASKITRYYLGAAQDRKLMSDGRAAFQKAKQIAGFNPPDQKFVSPKVLTFYQGSP
jgi:hypothetical protein